MTHKHTPAPWEVNIKKANSKDQKSSIWITAKEGGELENGNKFSVNVCRIVKSDGFIHFHEDTYIANSSLIAAAPELLEALEYALKGLELQRVSNVDGMSIDEMKKAIEKAKGKS